MRRLSPRIHPPRVNRHPGFPALTRRRQQLPETFVSHLWWWQLSPRERNPGYPPPGDEREQERFLGHSCPHLQVTESVLGKLSRHPWNTLFLSRDSRHPPLRERKSKCSRWVVGQEFQDSFFRECFILDGLWAHTRGERKNPEFL